MPLEANFQFPSSSAFPINLPSKAALQSTNRSNDIPVSHRGWNDLFQHIWEKESSLGKDKIQEHCTRLRLILFCINRNKSKQLFTTCDNHNPWSTHYCLKMHSKSQAGGVSLNLVSIFIWWSSALLRSAQDWVLFIWFSQSWTCFSIYFSLLSIKSLYAE